MRGVVEAGEHTLSNASTCGHWLPLFTLVGARGRLCSHCLKQASALRIDAGCDRCGQPVVGMVWVETPAGFLLVLLCQDCRDRERMEEVSDEELPQV